MQLESLTAISPIDGRYRNKLAPLAHYFSEMGFMRYRVEVEIEYFIALSEYGVPALGELGKAQYELARGIYKGFSLTDAERIKEIEQVTNHDVKAVEYFIKEKFDALDPKLAAAREYVHFGLTSQDINNTSTPMMLRDAIHQVVLPACNLLLDRLESLSTEWLGIPMLARTHGQPASPTLLSKEIRVFVSRLKSQLESLGHLPYPGKFGGATGNLNAHYVAFPDKDWHAFATDFLGNRLGLHRSRPTTQIDHYDGLAAVFDNLKRVNTILTDLAIDMWLYISQDYFKQKTIANEVGSSAMPHKVNPIDFENAEGNFGVANAMLEFMSRKLPISRLQRDLTDSTVLRNVGSAVAHSYLAVLSLQRGLGKLEVNRDKIARDLEDNWAVVAEAIQTVLRRENYPNPYEALKELTRGKGKMNASTILAFIEQLDVPERVKMELRNISPSTFVGREDIL